MSGKYIFVIPVFRFLPIPYLFRVHLCYDSCQVCVLFFFLNGANWFIVFNVAENLEDVGSRPLRLKDFE